MLAEEAKSASIATLLKSVVSYPTDALPRALNWLIHCSKAKKRPEDQYGWAFCTNMTHHFYRIDP